jgi:hypothetical protein
MSISNLVPIEQYTAQLAAAVIISAGQGGDAQKILPRAQSALTFGNALAAVAAGDMTAALAAATAALQSPNMDPAVAASLQQLLSVGFAQLQLAANVNALVPLLGAGVDAVISNVSKGVITAANIEIATYSAPAKA